MKITIKEAAQALGTSEATVRAGLQCGVYPFGCAFRKEGKKNWIYTIYPAAYKQYVGEIERAEA